MHITFFQTQFNLVYIELSKLNSAFYVPAKPLQTTYYHFSN